MPGAGDLTWLPTLRSMAGVQELRRSGKQMIWDLLDVEVPIVCGLNGAAAGLGASIALLCDVVVMSERATILDPHVKVGVAAEVCPAEEVGSCARAWARRLADGAPLAVRGTKQAVNAQLKQALLTSFDVSTALELATLLSDDHAEAVDAFVSGRQPKFEGR